MATQTTNYGLTKPSYNETADIGVINSNMDIIDAKMKAIDNKAGSGGGGGNTDTYGHVKVGSVTIDASGDDTIELVAGSNVTLAPDTTSKSITISATGGGGGGTSDYLQLSNKPKINGVELVNNITTEDLGIVIPQRTSELENDSGFITNETDPTVPAWAKEPIKPTYTAEEVGALPSNTPIPDPTSVVVDRFVSEGTHIADISVNGEKTELYAPTGGGGTTITVDSELSATSENPVQNKVITQALNEKSNLISDAWNASTTYAVGQYCIYNNLLWKCLVQHKGQTPTEGTYWTKVSVANEITSVNNSIGDISGFTNATYDSIGDYIQYCVDNGFLPDINIIPLVPKMTSDTMPYGEAFGSGLDSGGNYHYYYAFDKNDSTNVWFNAPTNTYVGYKFTTPVCVKRVSMKTVYDRAVRIKNFKIQASNDNSTWEDIYSGTYADNTALQTFELDNNLYYLSYRLLILDNYHGTYNNVVSTLQFYGRENH